MSLQGLSVGRVVRTGGFLKEGPAQCGNLGAPVKPPLNACQFNSPQIPRPANPRPANPRPANPRPANSLIAPAGATSNVCFRHRERGVGINPPGTPVRATCRCGVPLRRAAAG
ncbi:hypothetical protein Poly21_16400 [Allorhodopirellula heiligendammensis]|uniref:Uncharacterized protein n=1 Tax=Allorhodopirellula heiligendammensis TaxID=2714739 RepID=A0A5C6C623_9BACT|nr:hypothetical protein Poly21_16400 [Allorhodopirellula heiligendammensis]